MSWSYRFTTLIPSDNRCHRVDSFEFRGCFPHAIRQGRRVASPVTLIALAISLASGIGCGKEARVKVAPVHGRVTYRGQGVPQATVIFFPSEAVVDKAKKMRPFARTDAAGNFELETYVDGDGAPLGDYRVSIIAVSTAPAAKPNKDRPSESTVHPALEIPPEVTKKYGSVESSGIQVTVHEGENNLPPFAL